MTSHVTSSIASNTSISLTGPLPVANRQKIQDGLDPAVLIDSIATCMAHEEKELCKTGQLAMSFIVETAATVLGSKQRVGITNNTGQGSGSPDMSVYNCYVYGTQIE